MYIIIIHLMSLILKNYNLLFIPGVLGCYDAFPLFVSICGGWFQLCCLGLLWYYNYLG